MICGRTAFPILLFLALSAFPAPLRTAGAAMSDYCQVPPYVIQNIPPNVLIVLDISGSMLNFAYYDGYHTPDTASDDNDCSSSGDPCTGYNYSGRSSTHRYYGYFDPNKWYVYSSNVFTPVAGTMDTVTKQWNYWSGDFLNWLTMRRIDSCGRSSRRAFHAPERREVPDLVGPRIYKRITAAEAAAYTLFTIRSTSSSTRAARHAEFVVKKVSTVPPWPTARSDRQVPCRWRGASPSSAPGPAWGSSSKTPTRREDHRQRGQGLGTKSSLSETSTR
jgi:hypothetical protein